jgi:hypothetical protein
MTGQAWITNNPDAARKLRAIDRRYERGLTEIKNRRAPLAEKVEALRKLKEARAMDYARVLEQA